MQTIDIESTVELETPFMEENLGFTVRTEHCAYKKYFRLDDLPIKPVESLTTFPIKYGVLASRFVSIWEMISRK